MKKVSKKRVVKIKNKETEIDNHLSSMKAKRKKRAFLKNVAIFLSAFSVLYLFFVLTFGNLSTSSKTVLYALSSGSFENSAEAYAEADKIKLVGGGGNIWQSGDKYKVLAFVYKDVESANEVQTRLKEEGLSLEVVVMEINTSKLSTEERVYVNSMVDISSRVYNLMMSMPDYTSETQTLILLEEIKKSMVAATARAETLITDNKSKENIIVVGTLVSDAFSSVASSESISTQSLAWLRTQILIYAMEYAENY